MTSIGFIGLGNMGFCMARNLLSCNRNLVVFDSNPTALMNMKKLGATTAETPGEVASVCPEIITMLPSEDEVETVFTQPNGILSSIKAGTLCIDCSTADYSFVKKISAKVEERNANYVDAPASGGVLAAQRATLTFMIGGDHCSYRRTRAVLVLLGRHLIHCGPVGTGQVAKLCNTLLFATEMVGLSEVLNLASKLGISPDLMTSIINLSSGKCFASESYNPIPGLNEDAPSSRGYVRGLKCEHVAKHLQQAQTAAVKTNTAIPLGALTSQIYCLLRNSATFKDQDLSVVIKFLQEQH